MKLAKVIHNAKAGAGGGRYDKDELLSLLASEGYECRYSSTKNDDWKHLEPGTELVIVAGGDGTVRKVAGWMQEKPAHERLPIAILPFGTANNIARALHINGDIHTLIRKWAQGYKKKFDVGRITGVPDCSFFLEGVGCGVFPQLIKEMEKQGGSEKDSPEKRMSTAFQLLHRIVISFEAVNCNLELDGQTQAGKFLMVEILNIPSIGPNLCLAAHADPGDGELDVVLVPEKDRDLLADYIIHKMNGTTTSYHLHSLKAKKVLLQHDAPALHIDDKIVKAGRRSAIQVEVEHHQLEFIVADPAVL